MNTCLIFLLALLMFSKVKLSSEELYPFRDITKPIIQDERFEKIIILSPNRTGSTLLFMIFQYLFEDTLADHESYNKKVVKSHGLGGGPLYLFNDPKTYFVVPIRNPLDAFASFIKASETFNENEAIILLNTIEKSYLDFAKTLDKIEKGHLLFFKYEDFHRNFSTIFNELESEFQLLMPSEEKEKINQFFSRESMITFIKKFSSFEKRDSIIGIHGKHISSDFRPLEEIFSKEFMEIVSSFFGY